MQTETPDSSYVNRLGIYNCHGGEDIAFDDEGIVNWIVQKTKN